MRPLPLAEAFERGRALRNKIRRSEHGELVVPARDPVALIERQNATRIPELIPVRTARMLESPFAYYRGTPAVMANDLAGTPRTDIVVQASGDAHLANFGMFASPERKLVFDANDFDETLPAPWEWDVKRLATSMVIAGRANGFSAKANRFAAMETVRSYRQWMAQLATMRLIDVWYSHIGEDEIRQSAMAYFASDKETLRRRGSTPSPSRRTRPSASCCWSSRSSASASSSSTGSTSASRTTAPTSRPSSRACGSSRPPTSPRPPSTTSTPPTTASTTARPRSTGPGAPSCSAASACFSTSAA